MMDEVFQYEGANPPGLDIISQHGTVLWKHPQHGWLKATKGGGFIPTPEAEAQRLLAPVPTPTPPPESSLGGVGAGTTRAVKTKGMTATAEIEERDRAKREGEIQGELTRAKFRPEERADPMVGLGLSERAKVAQMVREGMSVEEAVKKVRPPQAAAQAEGLKP